MAIAQTGELQQVPGRGQMAAATAQPVIPQAAVMVLWLSQGQTAPPLRACQARPRSLSQRLQEKGPAGCQASSWTGVKQDILSQA